MTPSLILSIIAIVISVVLSLFTFYMSSYYVGKIEFARPTFIGGQPFGGAEDNNGKYMYANERLIFPITALNSGAKVRSLRFKAIINGVSKPLHNSIRFNSIGLNPVDGILKLDAFQEVAMDFTVMPKSSKTDIMGFVQVSGLLSRYAKRTLQVDLWYQEPARTLEWKIAYRINWDQWPKLAEDYLTGSFVSSVNFDVRFDFEPDYDSKIIEERETIPMTI